MANRICHRIKPNHGTEGPANFVFFDIETWPRREGTTRGRIVHKFRLGVAVGVRWEKGASSRRVVKRLTSPADFWEFLGSRLSSHRPTYVFAHNLPFDFRLVDGFRVLENPDHADWRLCLKSPPTILRGKLDGKSVTFLDSLNYFRSGLDQLGRQFGLEKGIMPPFTASDEDWYAYCERDVEVLERMILELRRYMQQEDLGVWGRTISQCSMQAFRHRFSDHEIFIHDNDEALALERMSYFGGRAECQFIGEYRGPVYQLDVNSLYPHVMREHAFPVKLVNVVKGPSVDWLRERLSIYGACASVLIDTRTPVYPIRRDRKPLYPVGVYRAVLCGPELAEAFRYGQVLRVEIAATYELRPLFRRFVDYFYGERMRLRASGQPAFEQIAKSLLNSLSGKFAQKAPKWVSAPHETCPAPWTPFQIYNVLEGTFRKFQAIGRVAQEQVDGGEAFDAFPAISGFITAHGRVYMSQIKAVAGPRNYLYEDTDSLIVTEAGLDNLLLAGLIHRDRLGALKLECMADGCVIRGIKDYELGRKVVIKGVRKDAEQLGEGHYREWIWDGMLEAIRSRGLSEVSVNQRTVRLSRQYRKGAVRPDGWTAPFDIFEEAHF